MSEKIRTTNLTIGLLSAGLCLGLSARSPGAPVTPVKPAVAAPAASMADLLSGKLYPNTVKRTDLMASYRLISLVDAQGRLTVCATQGTTLTLGGEIFLVVYLPPPPPPAKSADATAPLVIPADADAQLTLINMRDIQAIGGIRDVPPPTEAPAIAITPAGPSAPAAPKAPAP